LFEQIRTEANQNRKVGKIQMNDKLVKLYVNFQELLSGEEGQDLVEYALIISLVSVAAVVFLPALATAVSATFTAVEASL
jgi:pilus assembly protein Flp/PilA